MVKYRRFKSARGPLPTRYVILITFLFFIISTVFSGWVINKKIEPHLIEIAEAKTEEFAAEAINDAVEKKISQNVDIRKLIVTHQTGDQIGYSFDPNIYNHVASETTMRVQEYLEAIKEGELETLQTFKNDTNIDYAKSEKEKGIIYNIPLGMATNAALFSNLGPKVPVRFEIIGNVISDVEATIKEPGINNMILEIFINIKVKLHVIIPSVEKEITVKNRVRIGDLILPGKVPQYYNGGSKQGDVNPMIIPDKKEEKE
ncbi:sporulation protein YunB [Peribacillus loiseleuriae]|uniref:Sporulation protein n=1 Tax=Peribacillus loiseleuriae TaxID=1679170 RepID=A0A0K9GXG7_9BACI|nr:sporulation protein YunB [Peribacillus loiseleuriae]KMY51343.1 hypothetical protein AC625_18810 [Peribacillus loiseleuriae]